MVSSFSSFVSLGVGREWESFAFAAAVRRPGTTPCWKLEFLALCASRGTDDLSAPEAGLGTRPLSTLG